MGRQLRKGDTAAVVARKVASRPDGSTPSYGVPGASLRTPGRLSLPADGAGYPVTTPKVVGIKVEISPGEFVVYAAEVIEVTGALICTKEEGVDRVSLDFCAFGDPYLVSGTR